MLDFLIKKFVETSMSSARKTPMFDQLPEDVKRVFDDSDGDGIPDFLDTDTPKMHRKELTERLRNHSKPMARMENDSGFGIPDVARGLVFAVVVFIFVVFILINS